MFLFFYALCKSCLNLSSYTSLHINLIIFKIIIQYLLILCLSFCFASVKASDTSL